jgi:quinol monooxygenase YgiN
LRRHRPERNYGPPDREFCDTHISKWQAAYRDLEKYVAANERSSTLAYYFGVPVEYGHNMSASPQMIAYEAYNVRSDLYETHFHSPAMDVFLSKIPPLMTTGLDLTHFEDTAGFVDKTKDMRECEIFYVTQIWCKEGKREEVLKRLGKLAKWVEGNEGDTYTFSVLKSLDRDDYVRVFERYATRKALEEHMARKEVLEFFMGSKDLIKSMEGRGYTPNGAGWLHPGWHEKKK